MLKLHYLFEHGGDFTPHACSYIRFLLPLSHSINSTAFQLSRGGHYEPADIIVVERFWKPTPPWTPESLIRRLRTDGSCLIYLIDDNLLDLTADRLGGQWSLPAEDRKRVEYFASAADGLIVSTSFLKERLAALNDCIYVVPNAVDERLFVKRPPAKQRLARKVLGFMGTGTHDADLAILSPALRKVLERHRDTLEFQLIGGCASEAFLQSLEGLPVKVLEVGAHSHYPDFIRWLTETVHWDLAVAPLEDSPFTRCKSDMKFLDYSALGVPGIYSRVPAYENTVQHLKTGYLVGSDATAWEEAIEKLLADDGLRLTLALNAEAQVRAERTLEHCAPNWQEALSAIYRQHTAKRRPLLPSELRAVSVIILNYNGLAHLEACLSSLMDIAYPQSHVEIIVVDNASTDGSAEWIAQHFPQIRLLKSPTNLGFSQGVNLGAQAATSEYLAFLNNDMRLPANWLGELVKALQSDEQRACVGSAILNWDGTANDFVGRPDDAFCFATDLNLVETYVIPDHVRPFLFVSAGAALLRAEVFRACGGFDPDYFMYHEDVDLGWRMWLRGYQCVLAPSSLVYHRGGASSGKLPSEFVYGLAQKHALFTLFKNLEAATLKELLPLVFYLLLERGRWVESLRVSLPPAIAEFFDGLEPFLAKRQAIQQTRVISDEKLFSLVGHPFAYLFKSERYRAIQSQLIAQCSHVEVDLDSGSAATIRAAFNEWLNAAHWLVERDWIAELHHQSNERTTLLRQYEELDSTNRQTAEQLQMVISQLDTLSPTHTERAEQVQQSNSRLETLSTQLVEKDTQLVEKETQLAEKDTQLAEKETQLVEKETQLAEKDTQLAEKDTQLAEKETQLVEKETQCQSLAAELAAIKNSRGWRWLERYWDFRLRYWLPVYRKLRWRQQA